jgi:hypothetical protein
MTTASSPVGPETRMQAINQSLERADWMGAAVLAETALQAGDQGPLLLKLRARHRQQTGRWAQAR